MTAARKKLQLSGLQVYKNKTLDQMTDAECEECLQYIWDYAGVTYILTGARR